MTDREIIERLSREVMGWTLETQDGGVRGARDTHDTSRKARGQFYVFNDDMREFGNYWNPLERIDHAWMIVEKMRGRCAQIDVWIRPDKPLGEFPHGCYMHSFADSAVAPPDAIEDDAYAAAETAPRAICAAALAALGKGKEQPADTREEP